jgi:hypothetical protein
VSEETVTTVEGDGRKRSWLVPAVVYGFLYLLVVWFFGIIVMVELPIHLVCGWAIHAHHMLPPLLAEWPSALRPLAALMVAGFLLHRFIRWAIHASGGGGPWPLRSTLAAMGLLLSGYAAAITLIGIAHQSTWLLSKRWIGNGRSGPLIEGVQALTQTQSLTQALEEFHATKGRYPEALEELDVPKKHLFVKTGDGGGVEAFIYLKPKSQPGGPDEPVIVSPMVGGRHNFMVGFTSMTVRAMNWEQLEKLLNPAAPPPLPHPARRR